jgi:pimeloyl-ACP methyl ester carboxylesterase
MNDIIRELNNMGIDALRVDLRGHGSNYRSRHERTTRLEALTRVTATTWRQEVACAYLAARNTGGEGQPLFLVAFSLGALAGVELANRASPAIYFDKMVLLAPALRTRWYTDAVLGLGAWPRLVVPSFAPEHDRANPRGTPVAAYLALLELRDRLRFIRRTSINVPTLVFVDEDDELVSAAGIRKLIAEYGLHRWSGVRVIKSGAARGTFHHAITNPEYVGTQTWRSMIERMRYHLTARGSPP